MNYLKNNNLGKRLFLTLAGLILVSSCTKDMEGFNKNLKGVSPQDLTVDAAEAVVYIPGLMNNIISGTDYIYQLQQNLGQDVYSGYLMSPTPFAGNVNNLTYAFIDGWVNNIWSVPSGSVLNQWLEFKKKGYDTKYPDLYGIALICKVFAASRAADAFGPIPYSKYGDASVVEFDSEEVAYNTFFADLNTAITSLTATEDADATADQFRFKKADRTANFNGDYKKWVKLANTLRLRLAIRISRVSPAKAKTEGEAAAAHKYGLLEAADGNFSIKTTGPHPIFTIANSWGDIRLGAAVETYLGGYKDPRLAAYAFNATDAGVTGQVKGIRQGVEIVAKDTYSGYSIPNIASAAPVKVMDASESFFLRAEGALRGWNMGTGTAKSYYEGGIRASFTLNGTTGADAYITNATNRPGAYVDTKNAAYSSPALTAVTVAWDDAASFDTKLEKVIIQKWIALYPEGCEAWAEFRRTGYPKLYPVTVNNSGGKIAAGAFVKRFPYSTVFTNASKAQVDAAVSKYLGGSDSPAKSLWWDIN